MSPPFNNAPHRGLDQPDDDIAAVVHDAATRLTQLPRSRARSMLRPPSRTPISFLGCERWAFEAAETADTQKAMGDGAERDVSDWSGT
jgi:hypothetical protein